MSDEHFMRTHADLLIHVRRTIDRLVRDQKDQELHWLGDGIGQVVSQGLASLHDREERKGFPLPRGSSAQGMSSTSYM